MKKISTIILVTLLFSIAALAQSKDEKAKAEIHKVLEQQAAAWNRGSIDGFMQGYWNSPQLTFVSGTNVTRGWQPTIERYKKSYDTREKMGVLSFSDLEITILSKDAALVLGNWALQREKDKPAGKFTLIFRRFKDGWKIVHDHTS